MFGTGGKYELRDCRIFDREKGVFPEKINDALEEMSTEEFEYFKKNLFKNLSDDDKKHFNKIHGPAVDALIFNANVLFFGLFFRTNDPRGIRYLVRKLMEILSRIETALLRAEEKEEENETKPT